MFLNTHDDSLYTITANYKTYLFDNDFQALFPEIFLVSAGIFLLIYGVIYSTSKDKNYPILLNNISWLTLLALVYSFLLILNNPIE